MSITENSPSIEVDGKAIPIPVPFSGQCLVNVYQVPLSISNTGLYVSIRKEGTPEILPVCLGTEIKSVASYRVEGGSDMQDIGMEYAESISSPFVAVGMDVPAWAVDAETQKTTRMVLVIEGGALSLKIHAPLKPLEEVLTVLKARLASVRWGIETGGLTLPDGTKVLTDRESQYMVNGAYTLSLSNPDLEVDFKAKDGWVKLTAAQIKGIFDTVAAHVQACFSRERSVSALLDGAPDSVAAVGVYVEHGHTGWPGA